MELKDVVPLTGHVDRNTPGACGIPVSAWSCPSRGTWIEILCNQTGGLLSKVVPLTGHVDRNYEHTVPRLHEKRRAPHGARG